MTRIPAIWPMNFLSAVAAVFLWGTTALRYGEMANANLYVPLTLVGFAEMPVGLKYEVQHLLGLHSE